MDQPGTRQAHPRRFTLVRRKEIVQIVQGIPAAWEVNQAARDAWVSLICLRAGWLADNLPRLLWAQQEMNLDNL